MNTITQGIFEAFSKINSEKGGADVIPELRKDWGRNHNFSNPNANMSVQPNLKISVLPNIEEIKSEALRKSDWASRDNRTSHYRGYALREEEELFAEHLEQVQKKKTFDFDSLSEVHLNVSFRGQKVEEISDLKRFDDITDLDYSLRNNIKRMCFDCMTPIQKAVIPYLKDGQDVMGCSETGSGKTVAYLLPIVCRMLNEGPPISKDRPHGSVPVTLILVPTRELAEQVYKESKKVCHKTGINTVKIYGGVGHDKQLRDLSFGCDILVATPGRLIDFMQSKTILLGEVKYLIIDEADRLLDMGFEPQLNSIIFEFDLREKEKRQNLMFSATFDTEVRTIARKFMNEFYFVHSSIESRANKNIKQKLILAKENEKTIRLHQILQQISGSIIIFLDTKRGVDDLCRFLEKSNYNAIAIHGGKKQMQRQEAIKKFTDGHVPILVATDVASRGLDFPKVSYVFNFDMPSNIDDYIHRIGRTGRCGQEGIAISFINESNRPIIKGLYFLMKDQNQEIPQWFTDMYHTSLNDMPSKFPYARGTVRNNDYNSINRKSAYISNHTFGRDNSNNHFSTGIGRSDMFLAPAISGWGAHISNSSMGWSMPNGSSILNPPGKSLSNVKWETPSSGNFSNPGINFGRSTDHLYSNNGFNNSRLSTGMEATESRVVQSSNDKYEKFGKRRSRSRSRSRDRGYHSRSRSRSKSKSKSKSRSRSRNRDRSRNTSRDRSKDRSHRDHRRAYHRSSPEEDYKKKRTDNYKYGSHK